MNRLTDKTRDAADIEISPLVMGIVNTSQDSLSESSNAEKPLDRALRLLDEGADIIDIGGESTRPGAVEITPEIEIERVLGVLRDLKRLRPNTCISIDTRKSVCAKVFLDNGADIINDVSGLEYSKDMAETAAAFDAYLIIMHSISAGVSATVHKYDDVVREVYDFLQQKYDLACEKGVRSDRIFIDPGIGFSKNSTENFELLRNIPEFSRIAPVLIGHSRKRFIREYIGSENIDKADEMTALISVLCAAKGAAILRVHDVRRTVAFLDMKKLI